MWEQLYCTTIEIIHEPHWTVERSDLGTAKKKPGYEQMENSGWDFGNNAIIRTK